MTKLYDNATGDDILHVVNEPPISFFITYIVPKSSPFIHTLNFAISQAKEFGFVKLALAQFKDFLEVKRMKRMMNISKTFEGPSSITMANIKDVFIFYIVCISACFIVFLIEVLFGYLQKHAMRKLRAHVMP